MIGLCEWAMRHNISNEAMNELIVTWTLAVRDHVLKTESDVSNAIRLEASVNGWLLFRNNVGAGKVDGNFMRWGLANDSKKLNEKVKSADLIGLRPVLITEEHFGQTIGQFVSIETKAPGWAYSGKGREVAQAYWQTIINANGGYAVFATSKECLK